LSLLRETCDLGSSEAVALFRLTATPTGRAGGGAFTVDTVGGTPLFTSADGDFWTVGQRVRSDGPAVTMELPAHPARCDSHAFGAATGGTTFFVNITIGQSRPAQIRLATMAMQLGMARASLTDAPELVRRVIEQTHDEATEALAELRQLVRGLHPAVLDDRGLDAALSGIAANAPLPVRLRVDVATRCAPAVEAVAYFVVSEALTNVAKHANATHAEVSVERTGDQLHVVIADNGHGGATLAPADTSPDGGGSKM